MHSRTASNCFEVRHLIAVEGEMPMPRTPERASCLTNAHRRVRQRQPILLSMYYLFLITSIQRHTLIKIKTSKTREYMLSNTRARSKARDSGPKMRFKTNSALKLPQADSARAAFSSVKAVVSPISMLTHEMLTHRVASRA